jgi:hypothetical protein
MPVCYVVGLQWGIEGLAFAWLGGMALLCAATAAMSLPQIGVSRSALAAAIAPGLGASLAMALLVAGLDRLLPPMAPLPRLGLLVGFGAAAYAAVLYAFARTALNEALAVLPGRRARTA